MARILVGLIALMALLVGQARAQDSERLARAEAERSAGEETARLERERQQRLDAVQVISPPPARFARPVAPVVGVYPQPQSVFRDRRADGDDCPECPELVVIPAGRFTMGASAEEEQRENVDSNWRNKALPLTEVTIAQAFAVGRYSVTRGEFAAFARSTNRAVRNNCSYVVAGRSGTGSWQAPGFPQDDRHPVVCVDWNDAQDYLRWLAERTGHSYRLLSEAEWEYAARAGTTTARYWGDGREAACDYANVADQDALAREQSWTNTFRCRDGYVYTAPVGNYRANAFGLYDMLGNVWQWVEDCWNENYRGRPTDGRAWLSGNCQRRVLRAGGWDGFPWIVRSGYRFADDSGSRFGLLGFRVARTIVTP